MHMHMCIYRYIYIGNIGMILFHLFWLMFGSTVERSRQGHCQWAAALTRRHSFGFRENSTKPQNEFFLLWKAHLKKTMPPCLSGFYIYIYLYTHTHTSISPISSNILQIFLRVIIWTHFDTSAVSMAAKLEAVARLKCIACHQTPAVSPVNIAIWVA